MARALIDSTIRVLPTTALLIIAAGAILVAAEPSNAEAQFAALCNRYQAEQTIAWSELEKLTEAKERSRVYQQRHPANSMVGDFLKFEVANRGTLLGFCALHHLVSTAGGNGFVAEFSESAGGRQAMKTLAQHYVNYPDLDVCFFSIAGGGDEAKLLLQKARTSSNRDTRGAATLKLAEIYKAEATLPTWFDSILELLNTAADKNREMIELYTSRRQKWTADPGEARREAMKLLAEIEQHYANVLEPPRTPYGPILIKVDRAAIDPLTNKNRRTLADRAESLRFQLTSLSIGQPAPEIAGLDAFGRNLKLSDQRGKVTVLMFSFKGCGPCEAMYSGNRKLVELYRHRPFAFLGVMGDEDVATVKEAVDSGTITWHVWWDGVRPGTIANRWNVVGWPDIYVLDHRGNIRYTELTSDLLEIAVARLIKETEASAK